MISGTLWGAFGAIVLTNILLSGDNAVVIALAARSLPPRQQKQAIFWGSAAAIVILIALTAAAVELLKLPYIRVAGACALVWIGAQLLVESSESEVDAHPTLGAAIRTILVADLVMSTDNVVAVAGVADRAPEGYRLPLLVAGLTVSIPLIVVGSTLLTRIMDRFPILIVLGAALLGFIAGDMLADEPALGPWLARHLEHANRVLGAAGAVLVIGLGRWFARRTAAKSAAPAPEPPP